MNDSTADGLDDATVAGILTRTRRVALVGASPKPERASNAVMRFLLDQGYDVVPVNPGLAGQAIHGCTVVATLEQAVPLEMVDIFRATDQVAPVVDEAIRLGARTIWMQLDIAEPVSAARARDAGLSVVMDRCPKIEWRRLGLGPLQ
ncbi:MAG: CoA-binding protein [Janthinobacterium lividum]